MSGWVCRDGDDVGGVAHTDRAAWELESDEGECSPSDGGRRSVESPQILSESVVSAVRR